MAKERSAIFSAEERRLLDSMDSVKSRASDDRGYESNEEPSTPKEVGSSSNSQLLVNYGKKPIRMTSTTDVLSHDKQLLDAMLNAHPFEILGRDPYSAKRANRRRNEVQQQVKQSDIKSQDVPNHRAAEEGVLIEVLPQCIETVQINASKELKSQTNEKSRSDNVRRPPMRNAKLKQVAPTITTKSNQSRKKS